MKWIFYLFFLLPAALADFLDQGNKAYDEAEYEKAEDYWRFGCFEKEDENTGANCYNLGLAYKEGMFKKDYKKAILAFRRSCDFKDYLGCTDLGYMLEEGLGIAQDLGQAATLWRESCRSGVAMACFDLGYMYKLGKGLAADMKQALKLYKRSCELGYSRACAKLGFLYEDGSLVEKSLAWAKSYYSRACDMGEEQACKAYEALGH